MTDRFAVHFHCPLINFHERDGDPYEHIEQAIAHARLKADSMLVTSVNKIKILEQFRDAEGKVFRIVFGYSQNNKPTGAYIEVRVVPKYQQSKALGHQERHAGISLGE